MYTKLHSNFFQNHNLFLSVMLQTGKNSSSITYNSSPPEVFLEKGFLKICNKFTGKHSCQSVILIKLLYNFIEITLRDGYSPVNLLHIFGTSFSKSTSGGLLVNLQKRPPSLKSVTHILQ